MTREVRIYQPTKSAMQSGRAKCVVWRLEFVPAEAKRQDPLMGWIGSGDTATQVKLTFDSLEDAIAHAERQGWRYTVEQPATRVLRPKSYADNFSYHRLRS
ncbi:MAG: oxidoreductase [Alphaproteobacteria bacterium]|nr:ETC complex I subunit [Alphaproteobacteria bacterium]TAD88432.1 MAG: oxidoreductase [Alphaproteobacteria bacterium]